jgi:anti-sigma-K factor RskA
MNASWLDDDALVDLLVQLETEGLAPDEARRLDAMLARAPGASRDAFAPAAAALTLAHRLPADPLPAGLEARLLQQGREAVRRAATEKVVPLAPRAQPAAAMRTNFGWYAAAASLLLAVAAWWPRFEAEGPVAVVPLPVTTPAQQRAALVASGRGVVRQAWTGTDDAAAAAGLAGDVVWDPVTQTGYMRFTGLAANDATIEQYQLWIFDGTRDDRYPVDGGVFDVPAGATEVVVPIHARLPVRKAALFAVTVESPGGVVVSSRERIVALAQVAAS